MFTKIEATIPVYGPGLSVPVHGFLEIDLDEPPGELQLTWEHPMSEELLMMLRNNQLLGFHVYMKYIDQNKQTLLPEELTKDEMQLVDKLVEAGVSELNALAWVMDIIEKRLR